MVNFGPLPAADEREGYVMAFLAHFARVKVEGLGDSVLGWLVSLDPAGATEAQLGEMEEQFDKANLELQKARDEYVEEQKQADAAVSHYTRMLGAAQKLQAEADALPEGDPQKAVKAEKAAKIAAELETNKADVLREKQEAADAKALYEELDAAVREAGERLKTARARITAAQRDMQRAGVEKKRAETTAERASMAAGLRHTASAADTATSIFERHAQEARQAAAAARNKAEILAKTPSSIADDPDVKAAMGDVVVPPADTSARLAALAL